MMSSMASWESFQVTVKTTICLECIAIFRQPHVPTAAEMLIICQQFLHLMPLPTVTGLLSNECPKLSPTRCVYNLSWVLWVLCSRSVDQSVLLDKFCKYNVNIIKFRLTLGPQSTKTAGKNDPSTAREKRTSSLKLETSPPSMLYNMTYLCIYIWYMYQFICIYIYYVVCVCGYIYIYIPTKGPTSTPFQTVTNLNWPKIFGTKLPGFPWPIDPSKAGPRKPWKYCGWSMTGIRKFMGLWNIPENNWVV